LLRRAEADLEEAVAWYEARSSKAARNFEAAVSAALVRIAGNPELYPLEDDLHRICPMRKSQYVIVYRHDPAANVVVVIAVAHAKQDPRPWQ
jgi:plasmid stabilization system protein ParE